MRPHLLALALLPLLHFVHPSTHCQPIGIHEMNRIIDLDQSQKVTGVTATRLQPISVKGHSAEVRFKHCVDECCKTDNCTVISIPNKSEGGRNCDMIQCEPIQSCVWMDLDGQISSVVARHTPPRTTLLPTITKSSSTRPVPTRKATTSPRKKPSHTTVKKRTKKPHSTTTKKTKTAHTKTVPTRKTVKPTLTTHKTTKKHKKSTTLRKQRHTTVPSLSASSTFSTVSRSTSSSSTSAVKLPTSTKHSRSSKSRSTSSGPTSTVTLPTSSSKSSSSKSTESTSPQSSTKQMKTSTTDKSVIISGSTENSVVTPIEVPNTAQPQTIPVLPHQHTDKNQTAKTNPPETISNIDGGQNETLINRVLKPASRDDGKTLIATPKGALIAAFVFGTFFTLSVIGLVTKRCYDSWQRRHYHKVIEGLYA